MFPVLNNRGIEGNEALGNFGGIVSFVFPNGLTKRLADWEKKFTQKDWQTGAKIVRLSQKGMDVWSSHHGKRNERSRPRPS